MSEIKTETCNEPSVESNDPEERKLARQIRIKNRQEAQKKQAILQDAEALEETETERQINVSSDFLEKLVTEGNEVVSNVRVANDAREINRREEDIAIREMLRQIVEKEAESSQKKYEEINSQWSTILKSKDPLDIHAAIEAQSIKCREVLAQKDEIINQLKKQLEEADAKFAADQKKQNEDINLLIERIDNQINIIAKAYRTELSTIEGTLTRERVSLLESIVKKWETLFKQRRDDEIKGVEQRREIMRKYEQEMSRIMLEYHEQHRAQKIWLETECEKLQQQVEDMKVLCLMNVEKLDYNYTILKRREEENVIVKNQQKKRIIKLQKIVSDLKKNYAELDESTREKISKLQAQMSKSHKNIVELQAKSEHFTSVNEKQYMQIWEMNTKNANKLVDEIFTIDKIVYEQMLGLTWEPPETTLLHKEDLPSYSAALKMLQQEETELQEIAIMESSPRRTAPEKLLLNHILRQISEQTGFLVEKKLHELLNSYMDRDQVILKLDNVFQALNINTEEEILLLINFFLPYAYCPICVDEKATTNFSNANLQVSDDAMVENLSGKDQGSSSERRITCEHDHLLKIHSDNVVKALREFMEKYNVSRRDQLPWKNNSDKSGDKRVTLSRSISAKDITEYWNRYREIFSPKKEQLWDALTVGLGKYHEILKERQKLIAETDSLRRQNSELRRLLETCKVKSNIYSTERLIKSADKISRTT